MGLPSSSGFNTLISSTRDLCERPLCWRRCLKYRNNNKQARRPTPTAPRAIPTLAPVLRLDEEGVGTVAVDCVGDATILVDVETVFEIGFVLVEDSLINDSEIELLEIEAD
jgi:hypothetical protein